MTDEQIIAEAGLDIVTQGRLFGVGIRGGFFDQSRRWFSSYPAAMAYALESA